MSKNYEKLSLILAQLVEQRRKDAHSYEDLLQQYIELVKKAEQPENNSDYPVSIRKSGALRAFYDNFGNDEQLALTLDQTIRDSKEADFRNNQFKAKKIKRALFTVLGDQVLVESVYALAAEQPEY